MIISLEKAFASNINIEILASSVLKWKDVLENDPNNPEANYALGLTYLNQKLRDAALQHLQKASLLIPESPIIHYNLAVTLFNDGNCELDSEDYKNVVKEIDYALLLDPSFREAKAFKHFFIARKLDRINEAEAIKEYEAAIQECLDIAVLHNNLGLANYKIKNYSNARTCYLKAIEIDPEYLLAFNNLCLLCYSTGKYEDGVQYGNKAIELIRPTTLDTSQAFAYNNLSLCLWKTGRWDEAIQMMDRALAIRPNDPLFQANRKNIQTDKPLPPLTEKVRSRIKRNNAILIVLGILFVLALVTIYMWSSLGSH
jgi:superkiller protein 3